MQHGVQYILNYLFMEVIAMEEMTYTNKYEKKRAEDMKAAEIQREEDAIVDAAYNDFLLEQAANDLDEVMYDKQLQIDNARRQKEKEKIAALENELYELFCACA